MATDGDSQIAYGRGGNNQAPKDVISELPINLRIYRKALGKA
jgi:hypothetical protein